jgi:hypothetical protein
VPIVTVQSYLLNLLDQLPLPYGMPAAGAFITPPDPYVNARVPAIYIWPSEGEENRSSELGGTVPRNSGVGTPSGTKGMLHHFDIYLTWTGAVNQGPQTDPLFPGMIDAVMAALRYAQPNPAELTDPNTGLTSTVYNTGEIMRYRPGLEALEDERFLRYDALITVSVWEIMNA